MLELTVLIPCLNEEKTIENCIQKAASFLQQEGVKGEILVVDNGCTDSSVSKAEKCGARVIKETKKGYGNALIAGIRAAKGRFVIMGDADDSYDFSAIGPMLQKLKDGTDLVIGNRFRGGIEKGAMPFLHRFIGNPLLSLFGRMLYPCKARDFHCGLRGFDREKILALNLQSGGMEFASEMILRSKQEGLSIDEVPVKLYRDGREGKGHLNTVRDGLRHVGILLRYRPAISFVLTFILTLLVCLGLLVAVDCIPGAMLRDNMQKSAVYFMNKPLFGMLIDGHEFTEVDNYADCILTNIIASMDSETPFVSTIKASYYGYEYENVNVNFLNMLSQDLEPNIDYFRYWHGSMVLLRPLFCLFSIQGVRAAMAVLLGGLLIALLVYLCKKKKCVQAGIILLSFLAVQGWMTAFSLEYITTFQLMAGIMLWISIKEEKITSVSKQTQQAYFRIFLLSGMLTCFMDFLTTETLTYTMPLLLLFMLRKEKGLLKSFKEEAVFALRSGLAWGFGYIGMFLAKWSISMAVLGRQAFFSAFSDASFRMVGEVTDDNSSLGRVLGLGEQLLGTIWKNLHALFCLPEKIGANGTLLIAGAVLLVAFSVWYLFRKSGSFGTFHLLALCLAVLPYIRFLALRNHAYIHCFFTYRAQMVTVAAILAILWYSINRKGGRT